MIRVPMVQEQENLAQNLPGFVRAPDDFHPKGVPPALGRSVTRVVHASLLLKRLFGALRFLLRAPMARKRRVTYTQFWQPGSGFCRDIRGAIDTLPTWGDLQAA